MKLVVAVLCLFAIVPALAALQGCSDSTSSLANPGAASSQWSALSDETEFRRFRLEHIRSSVPAFNSEATGRGIVMHLTNAADVTSAYAALSSLRASGSKLSVQVLHTNVLNAGAELEFAGIEGVTVRSVAESVHPAMESSFKEVMVMSPRTFAVANPDSLFESAEFKETGVIAFPSLYKTSPANPIWGMLNKPCVDAHEQSSAVYVVNKEKAWAALHVAEHLSGSFFSSMLAEKDNTLAFGAMVAGSSITMAPASQAVASQYTVNGESKLCAHSTLLKGLNNEDLFLVSSNSEVLLAGSSIDAHTCLQGVESVEASSSMMSSIVRSFAAVPDSSAKFLTEACPADIISVDAAKTMASDTGVFAAYKTAVPTSTGDEPVVVTALYANFVTNCGGFWNCAGGTATNTVPSLFFNITSLTQSAHVRIYTPSYNTAGTWIQYGNETFLRAVDSTGLRDECDRLVTIGDTVVEHNIASGSWAMVAVSWMDYTGGKGTHTDNIKVYIRYTGASSGALANAVVQLPLMVIAAIVAFVAQRFF